MNFCQDIFIFSISAPNWQAVHYSTLVKYTVNLWLQRTIFTPTSDSGSIWVPDTKRQSHISNVRRVTTGNFQLQGESHLDHNNHPLRSCLQFFQSCWISQSDRLKRSTQLFNHRTASAFSSAPRGSISSPSKGFGTLSAEAVAGSSASSIFGAAGKLCRCFVPARVSSSRFLMSSRASSLLFCNSFSRLAIRIIAGPASWVVELRVDKSAKKLFK